MSVGAATRLPLIVLAAVLVNALMFTAIEYMVGNRQMRLSDTTNFDIANFIRVTEQSQEIRSRRDPRAPRKPDAESQLDLQRLASVASAGTMGGLNVEIPEMNIDIDVGGSIQIARELTPLVRVPAVYPLAARASETEGYVVLRFTVTEAGSVADPEILRSEPPGVFDKAARRAVLRWKYQPQIVDGKPVSVTTLARVRFEMESD